MMEEIMSMIFHGFKQVKDLESNLPDQTPEILSTSLDAIAKTFGEANERLKKLLRDSKGLPERPETPAVSVGSDQILLQIDPSLLQEYWLRSGVSTQAMDAVIRTQYFMASTATPGKTPAQPEGSGQLQPVERLDSGAGSALSTPRQRRRKDAGELQTVLVAAPRMGNTEIPPDDGYTWRKYGQKEILGSRFTRAYYRCTHQKLYNCPAKKQVQRLDDDPYTFRVTYRGCHTCHVSATASISSAVPAATSACRFNKDVDYPAVADMADAMFNPGGSSSNMDFIFLSDHHHQHHEHDHDHDSQRQHFCRDVAGGDKRAP